MILVMLGTQNNSFHRLLEKIDELIEKGIIKSDGSDIENIPYTETNNYVRKIIRDYKIYQELYED